MKPFDLEYVSDRTEAIARFTALHDGGSGIRQNVVFSAGGTTMFDLMKLNVALPDHVIDILPLRESHADITASKDGITIGGLALMSEVAANQGVAEQFPAIVQSLHLAASTQLRNAATIGGNILQRTRCGYFRDESALCNKRTPGEGCSAIGGETRDLAILGTSSNCIANYPGDLAVALTSFNAQVNLVGAGGTERTLDITEFYRLPGNRPDLETHKEPRELIASIFIPVHSGYASQYLKIRDRASYAFAITSVASAIKLEKDGKAKDVRITLGGVGAKPWRCKTAEEFLSGHAIDETRAREAADLCLEGAVADDKREFKIELTKRAVIKSLLVTNELAASI